MAGNTELLYQLLNRYTLKIEYNTDEDPIYIGQAQPGTSTDEAGWRLFKLTYNAVFDVTDLQWASGTFEFNKVWDDRSEYTYS